jgi:hypothetical protein
MRKRLTIIVLGVVFLSLLSAIILCKLVNSSGIFSKSERVTPSNLATETPASIIPTMAPVLQDIQFPNETVEYPQSWPSFLIYPDQFSLVDVQTGSYMGGDSLGWEAKLLFDGDAETASEILLAFFIESGWNVTLREEFVAGGIMIVVEKDEESSGIVTIEKDQGGDHITKVLIIIFH